MFIIPYAIVGNMKQFQRTIAIFLITIVSATTGQYSSNEFYKIKPITKNPGIFYEYKNEVRLIKAVWKIYITISLKSLEDKDVSSQLEGKINEVFQNCTNAKLDNCKEMIPMEDLEKLISEKTQLKELLYGFFEGQSHSLDKKSRSRRDVPESAPIEFIGWASRKLFGTMDAQDRRMIDQEIGNLYESNRNVSLLAAEQAHIVRSSLENVHEDLNRTRKYVNKLGEAMNQLIKLNTYKEKAENISYVKNSLNTWISGIKESLNSKITLYRNLINAVETTSEGHLHPLLLNKEQLQNVVTGINEKSKHQTHLNESEMTLGRLHSVSRTSVFFKDRKLIVKLEVPLLFRNKFQLYAIHPLGIPQRIHDNLTAFVSIKPSVPYLIVQRNKKTYFLATQDYLSSCIKDDNVQLCPTSIPVVNSMKKTTDCEFLLFHDNPTEIVFKHCDFIISNVAKTLWTSLQSRKEWLYSTINQVTLFFRCDNGKKFNDSINGTGLLEFDGKCDVDADDVILHGVQNFNFNLTYNYKPDIEFNLHKLLEYPDFNLRSRDKIDDISSLLFEEEKEEFNKWAESEDSLSLKEIENKFKDIAQKRRNNYQNNLTFGLAAGGNTLIIILVVMAVLIYFNKCRNRENSKSVVKIENITNVRSNESKYPFTQQTPTLELGRSDIPKTWNQNMGYIISPDATQPHEISSSRTNELLAQSRTPVLTYTNQVPFQNIV